MTEVAVRAIAVIGTSVCEIGDNWCRTTMADGSDVVAMAEDTDGYRQTAAACGYGNDTDRMCIDHEVVHSLLAHWLGQPQSHTLTQVAQGDHVGSDLMRAEEQAVLAIQAYANALGIAIRDLL
jgi:hypothetical protein